MRRDLVMLIAVAVLGLTCTQAPRQVPIATPPSGVVFVPQVQFRPNVIKAGGTTTIFGVGFTPRTRLNAYAGQTAPYDEIVVRDVGDTDADGTINATLTLGPELKPGRYMIFLADATRTSRSGGTQIVVE